MTLVRFAARALEPVKPTTGAGEWSHRRRRAVLAGTLGLAFGAPGVAGAHTFGQLYTLPVPLWLYGWGAGAALVVSFLAAGFFLQGPAERGPAAPDSSPPAELGYEVASRRPVRWLVHPFALNVGRLVAVLLLGLCIATGLRGTPNPYANFNMTLFWVVFALGGAWGSAAVGPVFELLSPWRGLADALARWWPAYGRGRLPWPRALGVWPALGLYAGFVWQELFGHTTPASLAWWLLGYTAFTLAMAGVFGVEAWFARGELFNVLFGLYARLAPVGLRREPPAADGRPGRVRVWLRLPLAGLRAPLVQAGEVMLVLFMLSSTAFDGLHETVPWQRLYWQDVFRWASPWVGDNLFEAYPVLQPWFARWQTFWLLALGGVYWLVYQGFVGASALAARATRAGRAPGRPGWRRLAAAYAPSLLPIALVYSLAHYGTLILTQGVKIVPLASDPFGTGADWLGTAGWFQRPLLPEMTTVWHVEVGLIVAGHVAGVIAAHLQALAAYRERRAAAVSQVPVLGLMVAFTVFGLWILAQPLQATTVG